MEPLCEQLTAETWWTFTMNQALHKLEVSFARENHLRGKKVSLAVIYL